MTKLSPNTLSRVREQIISVLNGRPRSTEEVRGLIGRGWDLTLRLLKELEVKGLVERVKAEVKGTSKAWRLKE